MRNINFLKNVAPRNHVMCFRQKGKLTQVKDNPETALVGDHLKAEMDETMEQFMKGSGMKEMNEEFPHMKMFAASLERIQSLGGLPTFTEDVMGPKKKKKDDLPAPITKRKELISPSKLLAYFENSDLDEIDKSQKLKEAVALIDSWKKPLTSLELASLRVCLVLLAKSHNILGHTTVALEALNRAEAIIDYSREFEESLPMSLITLERGIAYKKEKSYSLAIRTFNLIINNVDCGCDVYIHALVHRSKCHYHCGNLENALIDVNEVLCYREEDPYARFERSLYTFHSNPKLAQKDLEYILDCPSMSQFKEECYYRLGVLFSSQKKFQDSLRMYEKLEVINPKHHALEHARRYALDGLKESGEETVSPENSEKYRQIEKDLKSKSKKMAKLTKEIDQGSGRVQAKKTKIRFLEDALEAKINKKEQEVLLALRRKGVAANE